jgi:hypothetical protein
VLLVDAFGASTQELADRIHGLLRERLEEADKLVLVLAGLRPRRRAGPHQTRSDRSHLMVEPFSLGAIALTDGIKFLYAQAGEILKRRRERTAAPIPAPGLLEGELAPLQLDPAAVDDRAAELRRLRQRLTEIVEDIEPAEETDTEVVEATLALRRTIEEIVGQRITFRGEQREPTGTTITGTVRARTLDGRAGVDFAGTPAGDIRGEVITDSAGENADIAGVRISGHG